MCIQATEVEDQSKEPPLGPTYCLKIGQDGMGNSADFSHRVRLIGTGTLGLLGPACHVNTCNGGMAEVVI